MTSTTGMTYPGSAYHMVSKPSSPPPPREKLLDSFITRVNGLQSSFLANKKMLDSWSPSKPLPKSYQEAVLKKTEELEKWLQVQIKCRRLIERQKTTKWMPMIYQAYRPLDLLSPFGISSAYTMLRQAGNDPWRLLKAEQGAAITTVMRAPTNAIFKFRLHHTGPKNASYFQKLFGQYIDAVDLLLNNQKELQRRLADKVD
jgi:hypothetical protein